MDYLVKKDVVRQEKGGPKERGGGGERNHRTKGYDILAEKNRGAFF